MSDSPTQINVQPLQVHVVYRGLALLRTTLDMKDHSAFIHTDEPMPVGTVVDIVPDHNPDRRIRASIVGVIEAKKKSQGNGKARQPGMRLSFDATQRARLLGLEKGAEARPTSATTTEHTGAAVAASSIATAEPSCAEAPSEPAAPKRKRRRRKKSTR